ncbi:MAG TPA: 50S ribosomal protein L30 [Anaerolineaceae bacterium]|nr:50S ribosomal protein L30 [Chloroflexota bacterium]HNY84282.1 50S ribosomal protein L30 [Anaerolineaceae bacterium]
MAKKAGKQLTITLKKSGIGYTERTKRTLKALGFRKVNDVVVHEDNAVIRGMINKVSHLVVVEEAAEEKK